MKKLLFIPLLFVLFSTALPAQAQSRALYYVDRNDDVGGLPCTGAANDCTLRSAVQLANNSVNVTDSIAFLGDNRTITLTDDIDITNDNLTIFALSNQTINIDLNGNDTAFVIRADDITINRLAFYGGNSINSNGRQIVVQQSAQSVAIANNLFGNRWDSAETCGTYRGGYEGIYVISSAVAHIYGNTFRCLRGNGVLVRFDATVVVGENLAGDAEAAQRNDFNQNRSGVVLESDGSRVLNSDFSDHSQAAIIISGSSNNEVYGNSVSDGAVDGILLDDGAAGNVIGCTSDSPHDATRRNVIFDNEEDGIQLTDVGLLNLIACNYIGVLADGATAAPNDNGIRLSGGGGTFIGNSSITGSVDAMANVISGNQFAGISLSNSDNNLIAGNIIGAAANGTSDVGNGTQGIYVGNGSADNLIGEDTTNSRNDILFNGGDGVAFDDAGTGNEVQRNFIGYLPASRSAERNAARANNGGNGIGIYGTNGVAIGTNTGCNTVEFCLEIADNTSHGIQLSQAVNTAIGDRAYIFANDQAGIAIGDSSSTAVYAYIRTNGNAGVEITGSTSGSNLIRPRRIDGNSGLPIDLNADGATPNDGDDSDSGPNTLLNYPEVTNVVGNTVQGVACASCTIEVYQAIGNPRGNGGGGIHFGTIAANGVAAWSADLGSYGLTPATAAFIARDASGNTSEMSPIVSVPTAIDLHSSDVIHNQSWLLIGVVLLGSLTLFVQYRTHILRNPS